MRTGPFNSCSSDSAAACCPLRGAAFLLFAGLLVLAALPGNADEKKIEPAPKNEVPVDADALSAQHVKLPEGVKYEAIGSMTRMPSATEKGDEWDAFQAIVAHASQVPLSALKRHGRTALDPKLLFDPPKGFHELLSIKGRLIQLKRAETKVAAVKDVFEGWVWIYTDGTEFVPVKVILTELPEGFQLGPAIDEPVILEGYFFKVANFTGEEMAGRAAPRAAPVVIGRSFRFVDLTPPPPAPELSEAEQVALEPGVFTFVKDKVPLASKLENYEEYLAYTYVFLKVMQFSPEVLARNSRHDIEYADLINQVRETEYLRKLLHVEGTMVRLRKRNASEHLSDANIDVLYEGWIYHKNERDHPILVAFTELPEGMQIGEGTRYRVAVDGYYFKLLGYRSQEKDANGKDVWRMAPLLVARKPVLLRTEREDSGLPFGPLVLGVMGVGMLAALGLILWFRRGDQRARKKVRDAMLSNPFENAPTSAIQPGPAWNQLNEPPG